MLLRFVVDLGHCVEGVSFCFKRDLDVVDEVDATTVVVDGLAHVDALLDCFVVKVDLKIGPIPYSPKNLFRPHKGCWALLAAPVVCAGSVVGRFRTVDRWKLLRCHTENQRQFHPGSELILVLFLRPLC